ncbi:MAG: hypothetical protein IH841_00500 [Thaumarchaeota archaeon]|nr:hypothetical protein [Nitrososphaerota archaeon]
MKKITLLLANGIVGIVLISLFSSSFADEQFSNTEVISIDGNIGIEKTTLTFSVPKDNNLPWAFVEGKIANPVLDYPVIIQIYDNDDQITGNDVGAVHFAQADVSEDGTYEYKFRVKDINGEKTVNIFEGDYTVKIFKVVYLYSNLSST